ncbi:MAG: acylphosphatase [Candidatus Omnitrophica bacterium]|nr:acylphosphatase [Candidatus Omnitrophota bacterium]
MRKQIHVFYSGLVQGVGFRFTAREIAYELNVSGWVKNLRDGRVELVAEAEEEVLKEFLERINRYFSRYIQDTQIDWLTATGGFKGFEIRFI